MLYENHCAYIVLSHVRENRYNISLIQVHMRAILRHRILTILSYIGKGKGLPVQA